MTQPKTLIRLASALALTAIGAGVGAIGGSVLTGGSAAGTLGGAAVGGVIGHEIDKNKK
jgi:osmotically inducible lipoprotein OsmB